MFKRSTKITSLLVAAASVASMVPAYAADYKKVDSQDGTVYGAVAYKDGSYYIDGEINDKDEATYFVKDGKSTPLDDIDNNSDVAAYGEKYVEVEDGDYYVDLTNGKVTDDEVKSDATDDAATALRKKVKKDDDDRFTDATLNPTLALIQENSKFAKNWYEATGYILKEDGTTAETVYTDDEGNYIDADYNLGKIKVTTTSASVSGDKKVTIENSKDSYDTQSANDALTAAVSNLDVIGQDKDYIYRKATITVSVNSGDSVIEEINEQPVTKSVFDRSVAGKVSFDVIQKISKAQASDEVDGIKYAKSVTNYAIADKNGVKSTELKSDFTVSNGKVITYAVSGNNIDAKAITLDQSKGFYYTDFSSGDDQDLETATSFDKDVDGNLYALEGGYIYKFDNDEDWEKLYKVDGSFDSLSVYDADNIVTWSDDDVYAVIGSKTKDSDTTDTTATTTTTTTTTTTAAAGWVQSTTDGTWTYVNTDGTKKVNWFQDTNGTWYYLGVDGVMKTGWFQDTTGTWYYANESGAMQHDTTVGGYVLGSNGAWVQ